MLNIKQDQSAIQTKQNSQTQTPQLSLSFFAQVPQLHIIEQSFKLNTIDHQISVRDFDNQFELMRTITETKKHKLRLRTNNVLENKKNRYPQQSIYQHSRILANKNIIKIVKNINQIANSKKNINTYINANIVYRHMFPIQNTKQYSQIILTQAPLKQTLLDFLTVIVQNQINCVVMLCNVVENGKNKCYDYLNQPDIYDNIQIIENNKHINTQVQIRKIRIKIERTQQLSQNVQKQQQNLLQQSKHQKNYHQFYHILFTGWPDKNVPENPSHIDPIIEQLIKYNKIMIHCSAGLGRSGVIAVLYRVLKQINYYQKDQYQKNQVNKIGEAKLSVFKAVREIREDRYGAVQNNQQYKFIYQYLQYLYHKISKNVAK